SYTCLFNPSPQVSACSTSNCPSFFESTSKFLTLLTKPTTDTCTSVFNPTPKVSPSLRARKSTRLNSSHVPMSYAVSSVTPTTRTHITPTAPPPTNPLSLHDALPIYSYTCLFNPSPQVSACFTSNCPSFFEFTSKFLTLLTKPTTDTCTSVFNPTPKVSSSLRSYCPSFFKILRKFSSLFREPSSNTFHAFFESLS